MHAEIFNNREREITDKSLRESLLQTSDKTRRIEHLENEISATTTHIEGLRQSLRAREAELAKSDAAHAAELSTVRGQAQQAAHEAAAKLSEMESMTSKANRQLSATRASLEEVAEELKTLTAQHAEDKRTHREEAARAASTILDLEVRLSGLHQQVSVSTAQSASLSALKQQVADLETSRLMTQQEHLAVSRRMQLEHDETKRELAHLKLVASLTFDELTSPKTKKASIKGQEETRSATHAPLPQSPEKPGNVIVVQRRRSATQSTATAAAQVSTLLKDQKMLTEDANSTVASDGKKTIAHLKLQLAVAKERLELVREDFRHVSSPSRE